MLLRRTTQPGFTLVVRTSIKLTTSSSQTLLLSASLGRRPSCYLSETCGETLEEEDGPAPKNINLDHTELDGPHKYKSFCQEVTSNVRSQYITTNISYTELGKASCTSLQKKERVQPG